MAVGVLLSGVDPSIASPADGTVCDRFRVADEAIALENDAAREVSGVVASRSHPGVLWGVTDRSGDVPLLAFGLDGEDLGEYSIEGVEHRDWEDVAVGPGPDATRSYLYVGDIGDNEADRPSVSVIRVAEPRVVPDGNTRVLPDADVMELTYPDGPRDAEALLVDADAGQVVVITKVETGDPDLYVAELADIGVQPSVEMRRVGALSIDLPDDLAQRARTSVTAADVSPDGSIVLVRTYDSVFAFERAPGVSVVDALRGIGCVAAQVDEPQGESLAFEADGSAYLTLSEVGPDRPEDTPTLHRFTVSPPAGEGPLGTDDAEDPGEEDGRPPTGALVAGGLVLVLGVATVLGMRRRR